MSKRRNESVDGELAKGRVARNILNYISSQPFPNGTKTSHLRKGCTRFRYDLDYQSVSSNYRTIHKPSKPRSESIVQISDDILYLIEDWMIRSDPTGPNVRRFSKPVTPVQLLVDPLDDAAEENSEDDKSNGANKIFSDVDSESSEDDDHSSRQDSQYLLPSATLKPQSTITHNNINTENDTNLIRLSKQTLSNQFLSVSADSYAECFPETFSSLERRRELGVEDEEYVGSKTVSGREYRKHATKKHKSRVDSDWKKLSSVLKK